ncbi:PaaX family transcriptional regulator C-terminal domain-containing protein [Saccharopolyspora aridisoli]|uniref:PaaX family transcriptional regulator C-terminal domain-containing protein n=1 Tax=Saccharopolyspora aridisoli TaxID=2530385 RepID=UPI001F182088|nr:PaaX family transcriptional regulator C-terminal domain-containing protein [Saccharopolyspora aridisoli]
MTPRDLAVDAGEAIAELSVARHRPAGVGDRGWWRPSVAFALEPLARDYRDSLRCEPLRAHLSAGPVGPAEALRARTELRGDWRALPERDPDLPAELPSWGLAMRRRPAGVLGGLRQPRPLAELQSRQVLATADPELAELASHHDSARIAQLHAEFGGSRVRGDPSFEEAVRARRSGEAQRADRAPATPSARVLQITSP